MITHQFLYMKHQLIKYVPTSTLVSIWMINHIHVDAICSLMYFLRRLLGVEQKIMYLFYQAVIESVIRYAITVWFGNLTIQVKSKLARLLKIAMKTIGRKKYLSLESLYEQSVLREAHQMLANPIHVLHTYELLPSGRRYRFLMCRYKRFIPMSVKMLFMDPMVFSM